MTFLTLLQSQAGPTPPQPGPPLGGKGDNSLGERRRGDARHRGEIFKPTGMLDRPRRGQLPKEIESRVEEARETAERIAEQVRSGYVEEISLSPVSTMSMRDVEAEIGLILRKKIRTEEDDLILLLLMAAGAVC